MMTAGTCEKKGAKVSKLADVLGGIAGGVADIGKVYTKRREELMRGPATALWGLRREDERVYLHNVSRDVDTQEAWFIDANGNRQALGPVRTGEVSEIRALRGTEAGTEVSATVEWRVRSMILPWRSIWRKETFHTLI